MLYSPLYPAEDAIRLLKLHKICPALPESSNAPQPDQEITMECTLFHALRSEKPRYKALSYMWGEDTVPLTIRVNGVLHHVGSNLKKALEHIRSEEDVVLWVDAICINQENPDEKSEQVKRMDSIYRDAAETIVWLGPADMLARSDAAMIDLDILGGFVQEQDLRHRMIEMATLPSEASERSNAIKAQVTTSLQSFITLWSNDRTGFYMKCMAFKKLFSREYWNRVWILQEYALSANLNIRCGTRTVSFERFHGAVLALQIIKSEVIQTWYSSIAERLARREVVDDSEAALFIRLANLDPSGIATPVQGIRSRYQSNPQSGYTLLRLLARVFVERGAGRNKEPKDRIFAFLGMISDAEELGIVPDYADTRTYQEVYSEAARAIASIGQVDVLAFAQHRCQSQNPFPSWAPDWTRSCPSPQQGSEGSSQTTPPEPVLRLEDSPNPILRPCGQLPWDTSFNASSGAAPFAPHPLLRTLPKSKLPLFGYTIDTIEIVRSAWKPSYEEVVNHNTKGLSTYLEEIAGLCEQSDSKLAESGFDSEDCYNGSDKSDDPLNHPRATARYLIPIADMQQYGMGFIQRADPAFARRGYQHAVNDIQRLEKGIETIDSTENPGTTQTEELKSYYSMLAWQRNRRPYLGEKGTVGLAPLDSECGDRVVVFCGSKFTYVVRKVSGGRAKKGSTDDMGGQLGVEFEGDDGEEEPLWCVIGEAYTHGIMYGEYFRKPRKMKEFILV